jgi:hypothetical protein
VLATRSCSCFLGNQMVRFDILDCSVFLIRGSSILLVADTSVTIVSCVVTSVAKMLNKSRPSRVEVHSRWSPWTVPSRTRRARRVHLRLRPPTAQALVARLESKALDGTLIDDDPDLLTFGAVESEIIYRTSSWLQSCWLDSRKPDGPV